MRWLAGRVRLVVGLLVSAAVVACAATPPQVDAGPSHIAPAAPAPECGGRALTCRQVEQRFLDLGGAAPDVARRLEPECAQDQPGACAALGAFLLRGMGVARDDARAFHVLDAKCTAADDAACGWLGVAYGEGRGVHQDDVRARSLYERACTTGHLQGCVGLGAMLEHKAPGDAAEAYEQACRRGEPVACMALARSYAHAAGSPRDVPRAFGMYAAACDGGILHACVLLGEELCLASAELRDEARARTLFQRACDGGDAAGCSDLAEMVLGARGAAADPARGQALIEQACTDRTPEGCAALGRTYRLGVGVAPDYVRARGHLRRACDAGSGSACCQLAQLTQFGRGLPASPDEGWTLYERACSAGSACGCEAYDRAGILNAECDEGDAWECTHVGGAYESGETGFPIDLAHAAERYGRGCDLGDGHGCADLAALYRGGRGVGQDTARSNTLYARAAPLLQAMCEAGDARGCVNLGELLGDGHGAAPDPQRAAALYRRACDQGDLGGCNDLARLFVENGPMRDPPRAVELFKRACEGGDTRVPVACWNLGHMIAKGDGVPRDQAAAVKLFEQSCSGDETSGCIDLADAYEGGLGVAPDLQRAIHVRERACKQGVYGACPPDNPRTLTATVQHAKGAPGIGVGGTCRVLVAGLLGAPGQCRLRVECGGKVLYGGPHNYISCTIGTGAPHDIHAVDADPTSVDGDPMLDLDTAQKQARIRDDVRPKLGELEVVLALPPLR